MPAGSVTAPAFGGKKRLIMMWPGDTPESMKERQEKPYTPEQERMMKLLDRCQDIHAFEFEGVLYKGYYVNAVKSFCKQTNYPADFHVWLQNNYIQLNPNK